MEITVGTDKQIAYAKDVAARGNHAADAAAWIADFRAIIIAAPVAQEAKDKALAALDKLPTLAVFWLDHGYEFDAARIAVSVVAGQSKASLGAERGADRIYTALVA